MTCSRDGALDGAVMSDHGHVILSLFPTATSGGRAPGSAVSSKPDSRAVAYGPVSMEPTHYLEESAYAEHCHDRMLKGAHFFAWHGTEPVRTDITCTTIGGDVGSQRSIVHCCLTNHPTAFCQFISCARLQFGDGRNL